MKGQVTILAVVMFFAAVLVLCILVPIQQPFIDGMAASMAASSNPYGATVGILGYLIPVAEFIAIIVTLLSYANPRREGAGI